jgi:hypothetical protein
MATASTIRAIITLTMKTVITSETLVNFYETIQHNNPYSPP